MGSLAEIIWHLIKLPFIIIVSAFKLIIFIIIVIAFIYQPIPTIAILLGYSLIKIANQ